MTYTVHQLARLAGVSNRTLRYYDEIDLLKPAQINESGYRIYGNDEVDLLQQIMFYKTLGVGLDEIKRILMSEDFDAIKALKSHKDQLLKKRNQLNLLIENVEKTLLSKEEEITMNDQDKFEGFKREMIQDNHDQYGEEVIQTFGQDVYDASRKKVKNMTKEDFDRVEGLAKELIKVLQEAYKTQDLQSDLAKKAFEIHKEWLSYYWSFYSAEAHIGLGQMYTADERFKRYYDQHQEGLAEFLKNIISEYAKR